LREIIISNIITPIRIIIPFRKVFNALCASFLDEFSTEITAIIKLIVVKIAAVRIENNEL
jgi:hypothetical protein